MKKEEITVYGMVQGVGFRPFVAELAEELHIGGSVQNSGGIVHIEAFGDADALKEFRQRLKSDAPKEARIQKIDVTPEPADPADPWGAAKESFQIIRSSNRRDRLRLLPPDIATCPVCEKELLNPRNRRYRYPFISCTVCGPRFSILEDVPYDREHITMKRFPMCPECREEYTAHGNRRRHAQTIACHHCGPVLTSLERADHIGTKMEIRREEKETALQRAEAVLRAGGVIALKDIGGFHLAFLADREEPAKRLRTWKDREEKPFAVMFPDLDGIRKHCILTTKEEELLQSPVRPIVLVRQRDPGFWPLVSCGSDRMGVMLPADPLQILLLRDCGPMVMTSGNRGGEPIHIESSRLISELQHGFPDLILDHDREILTPLDDSIYQVVPFPERREEVQILRRARGLVPDPVWIDRKCKADTFAAGGDLKNTFAVGRDDAVYLSGHFGDLEWVACQKAREQSIRHMERLLDIHPDRFVGDLHPRYISTRKLLSGSDKHEIDKHDTDKHREAAAPLLVQHHLAHVLSVSAEHHISGEVLGIAYDGTGYGTDGTIWGSEFLMIHIPDPDSGAGNQALPPAPEDPAVLTWSRLGSLHPVRQMGGDEGARDGKKVLFSFLMDGLDRKLLTREELSDLTRGIYTEKERSLLQRVYRSGLNQTVSTSMGRLFDGAACALGISDRNYYEGESPIRLETAAHTIGPACRSALENPEGNAILLSEKSRLTLDGTALLIQLLRRKQAGQGTREELSLWFHHCVIRGTVDLARRILKGNREIPVLLAGGTFLNRILLSGVVTELEGDGHQVYFNHLVPPGDGGLSLGQIFLSTMDEIREI